MKIFGGEDKPTPVGIVDTVIRTRHSVRNYLPTPVPAEMITEILDVASRAPSGGNMQPWRVHVLEGASLQSLVNAACFAFDHEPELRHSEYDYYPTEFFEPYAARRRKVGWDLYELLGIERGDKDKMRAYQRRNFEFFGAPMGLIFTIERRLARGSWIDYGLFLQNIMLAARVRGLGTCPQASWIEFPTVVARELEIPASEMIVCGMAMGYATPDAPENDLRSERAPVDSFMIRHE